MILKSKEIAALNIIICLCFIFVPQANAFEIKKGASASGINAWLVEDHKNPLITMQFVMRGGSSADPKNKSGLAYLVSGLLDEGAGDTLYDASGDNNHGAIHGTRWWYNDSPILDPIHFELGSVDVRTGDTTIVEMFIDELNEIPVVSLEFDLFTSVDSICLLYTSPSPRDS